jgi:hypothetical protein
MTTSRPGTTTKRDRNTGSIKEGGLPKDKKTAASGDNRRRGDLDGNRTAAKGAKSARGR